MKVPATPHRLENRYYAPPPIAITGNRLTPAQAALAHEQSEKLKNKLSELTTKLDEVTQVMEEQQFELTCTTKVRQVQVDSNMKKLERAGGGEIETDKVDPTRDTQGTKESDSDENLEPTISGESTTINVTKSM